MDGRNQEDLLALPRDMWAISARPGEYEVPGLPHWPENWILALGGTS